MWRQCIATALLMLGCQSLGAQNCADEQSTLRSVPGVDSIRVEFYSSNSASRTLVLVDASGRAVLHQCPKKSKATDLQAGAFDEFKALARHAVDTVRNQPPRPKSSTPDEVRDILENGRIEGLCLSPFDGQDADVTLHLDGSSEHYSCVTGALLEFSRRLLGIVAAATE